MSTSSKSKAKVEPLLNSGETNISENQNKGVNFVNFSESGAGQNEILISEEKRDSSCGPQSKSAEVYLENLKQALRTKSSLLKCPFCRKSTETQVVKKCSVINILCFIFSTPVLWAVFKCFRGKDCNFYNANHSCNRCKREIAEYSAC